MLANNPDLTIASALELIKSGDLSISTLYEACRKRIDQLDPVINAFIQVSESVVPEQLGGKRQLPIPVAVKDLIDVAGFPTTAGSPLFFGGHNIDKDAFVVHRLRNSGAAIIGKTNTHEIALGVTGVNPHYGPVRNPRNIEHIAGGSSSGSAAAVAAGMAFAALGTDTGGSTRIPAALCGVVGLKPTRGRISLEGMMPLSINLDHAGILTRSVRDSGLVLQILAGYDPLDTASVNIPVDDYLEWPDSGLRSWRVAFGCGNYLEEIHPDISKAMAVAREKFCDLGAELESVDLSWLSELAKANSQMTQADAAVFHRFRFKAHPEWFGDDVRQRLEIGSNLTSSEYENYRKVQYKGIQRLSALLSQFEVLMLPTTPIPAPELAGLDALKAARELTRFTSPFNLTGFPAISVPNGVTGDGLPIGLQLVAGTWKERKLLHAGHLFETQ